MSPDCYDALREIDFESDDLALELYLLRCAFLDLLAERAAILLEEFGDQS